MYLIFEYIGCFKSEKNHDTKACNSYNIKNNDILIILESCDIIILELNRIIGFLYKNMEIKRESGKKPLQPPLL